MSLSLWLLCAAAPLLAIERVTYAAIWRHPEAFRAAGDRLGVPDPVRALRALFLLFKVIQLGVFAAWIALHADGRPVLWPRTGVALVAGTLMLVGQFLSTAVFVRLGTVGVFYGARFGRAVRWCTGFPFSWTAHPQYVGTVLSIWGLFLWFRYPAPDWYLLPALETVYYVLGAMAERAPRSGSATALPSVPSVPAQSPAPAPLPTSQ